MALRREASEYSHASIVSAVPELMAMCPRILPLLALLLLASSCAAQERGEAIYTVQPGDTLTGIARRFHVSTAALARRNGLANADRLLAKTRLLVPAGPATEALPPYHPPLPPGPPLLPCEVRRWPEPVEAHVEGCKRAVCSIGAPGERVCVCAEDYGERRETVLEEGGAVVQRWTEERVPLWGDTFEVMETDLDGNGRPERVIAWFDGASNGMAVWFWRLLIREPGQRSAPLEVKLEEYGDGSLVRRAEGRGCDVLQTRWLGLEDPLRGQGSYFAGRRLEYVQGALRPAQAPVRVRRLLRDFRYEREGQAGAQVRHEPARWLSEGWTEAWPSDPFVAASEPLYP